MREIHFAKFHGLSNDFIVSTGPDVGITRRGASPGSTGALQRLTRSICDRHTGVGADGFVVVLAPQRKGNHACIRFFNADGSEAEVSGNGIRCAAAYLLENWQWTAPTLQSMKTADHSPLLRGGERGARWEPGKGGAAGYLRKRARARPEVASRRLEGPHQPPETLKLETAAGVKSVRSEKAGRGAWVFRVNMGVPIFDPEKIPFSGPEVSTPVVGFLLPTSQGTLPITVTSMGNPHCSTFVADFDGMDWRAAGREIENSGLFPKRTNVEFIKVHSKNEIEVRFWERGVGQTASSGTGSCGAAVACILNGLTNRKVRVRTLAGILEVSWPRDGEVTLRGPAELISRGVYLYPERLQSRRPDFGF